MPFVAMAACRAQGISWPVPLAAPAAGTRADDPDDPDRCDTGRQVAGSAVWFEGPGTAPTPHIGEVVVPPSIMLSPRRRSCPFAPSPPIAGTRVDDRVLRLTVLAALCCPST